MDLNESCGPCSEVSLDNSNYSLGSSDTLSISLDEEDTIIGDEKPLLFTNV